MAPKFKMRSLRIHPDPETTPIEPNYYASLRRGDFERGLALIQHAIEQNDAHAMSTYAFLFLTGRGVERDLGECCLWYRESAVRGDPSGMAGLGMLYARGIYLKKDLNEGVFWLFQATKAGHRKAAGALLHILSEDPELFGIHFSIESFADAYADAFAESSEFGTSNDCCAFLVG